jgi:hypothetical protein
MGRLAALRIGVELRGGTPRLPDFPLPDSLGIRHSLFDIRYYLFVSFPAPTRFRYWLNSYRSTVMLFFELPEFPLTSFCTTDGQKVPSTGAGRQSINALPLAPCHMIVTSFCTMGVSASLSKAADSDAKQYQPTEVVDALGDPTLNQF